MNENEDLLILKIVKAKNIVCQQPIQEKTLQIQVLFDGNKKESKLFRGDNLEWNQNLYINGSSDLNSQYIQIILFMDGIQVGSTQYTLKRMKSQFLSYDKQTIKLQKNQKWTASLQIMMDSFYEQNTSMSMEPPVISLAPDYSQYREPDGLQYNKSATKNVFSCMDQGICPCHSQNQCQFFPNKFRTKVNYI